MSPLLPHEQFWTPISNDLLFSRQDPDDLRWGDCSTSVAAEGFSDYFDRQKTKRDTETLVGLWGYADDLGISLNGGRPGARYAPEWIRRFFYKLTPQLPQAFANPTGQPLLCDYGDWKQPPSLEWNIESLAPLLTQMLQNEKLMITLGGGHDYGAVDGHGFLTWHNQTRNHPKQSHQQQPQLKPLIINFDAHLDVRPWKTRGLHSGTPFSWLLERHPHSFEFIEVGIQKHCASPTHRRWVEKQGGLVLDLDFVQRVGMGSALRSVLGGTTSQQPCFISLDMDVFSQALAPGCSQSWDSGLSWPELIEGLGWLLHHKQVVLFGVYEVSPPLDRDHQTSKLAATLLNEVIHSWALKQSLKQSLAHKSAKENG